VDGHANVDASHLLDDLDLDMLENELQLDPFASDENRTCVINDLVEKKDDLSSDDLFGNIFEGLNSDELGELDNSPSTQVIETVPQQTIDDDDTLFGDGYDELMEVDFEVAKPEVNIFKYDG
jgi:hypothetical protein